MQMMNVHHLHNELSLTFTAVGGACYGTCNYDEWLHFYRATQLC